MAINTDATLVNAAFKEGQTGAMADVPNMKPLYDHQAKIGNQYMKTVTGIMKTLEEKKVQKETAKVQGLKPVKETIQKAYNALSDGEPLPEFVVNDFTGQIEALQDSFEKVNTEGKGDTRANEKERRRITAALAKLKNQAIDVRSKYMMAFQDPSSYNDPLIKGEDIDAFNSIATAFSDPAAAAEMFKNGGLRGEFVNGEYTIFTKGYSTGKRLAGDAGFIEGSENEEGMPEIDYDSETEEEYKYVDEKGFTGSDMVKALPYKNPASDIAVGEFLKKAPGAGKEDGASSADNRYRDNPNARNTEIAEALDFIKTDEDYHDMKSRRLEGTGMAPSFDQALGGMAAIPIEVLKNMFLDAGGNPVTDMATYFTELDKKGNKDDEINSGDFPEDGDALKTFMNNIETVKEEILNNKEIGAPIMAEYFADMKIKAYNDSYDRNTPKVVTKQKTAAQILNEQKFKSSQQEKQQALLDEQNTVYSIENEFSAGETTIGTGSRYAQKSEETTVENNNGTTTTIPAGWTLFVDGKVEKSIKTDDPDILDEITKHVTDTSGKHRSFEKYKSIENGHMYTGSGKWEPRGEIKEFPLKKLNVKDAEDGKYYANNNGTYYFTKKDGYKEIKE